MAFHLKVASVDGQYFPSVDSSNCVVFTEGEPIFIGQSNTSNYLRISSDDTTIANRLNCPSGISSTSGTVDVVGNLDVVGEITGNMDAGNVATGTLAVARGGTGTTTSTGTGSVVLNSNPVFGGGITVDGFVSKKATYCRVVATQTAVAISSAGMCPFLNTAVEVFQSADITAAGGGWNDSTKRFDIPFPGVWCFTYRWRLAADLDHLFIVTRFDHSGDAGSRTPNTESWLTQYTFGKQKGDETSLMLVVPSPLPAGAFANPRLGSINQGNMSVYAGQVMYVTYMGEA